MDKQTALATAQRLRDKLADNRLSNAAPRLVRTRKSTKKANAARLNNQEFFFSNSEEYQRGEPCYRIGVGIGRGIIMGGVLNWKVAVRVIAPTELDDRPLREALSAAAEIDESDLISKWAGMPTLHLGPRMADRPGSHVRPGVTVRHGAVNGGSVGTVSCLVVDKTGQTHVLTAGHAATSFWTAGPGDQLWRRDPNPGGQIAVAAYSSTYPPPAGPVEHQDQGRTFTLDYALAQVLGGAQCHNTFPMGSNMPRLGQVLDPFDDNSVTKLIKFGYGTGEREGTLGDEFLSIPFVDSPQGRIRVFHGLSEIVPDSRLFSAPGDSGALAVEKGTGRILGMVIAGATRADSHYLEDVTFPPRLSSFAVPLGPVLARHGLTVLK